MLREGNLLAAAQAGDEAAFGQLVEPFAGELHAHCYRMLGSVQDAEDALQDALLRAWRGLARFDGRGSLRAWLYRIATNTGLDVISRRPKRVVPIELNPPADARLGPGEPLTETAWLEPFPDARLGDARGAPDARYELRESVELAFVAALQHLPARQRAVLILREVLGFSAAEVAETLGTTTASVNSALQRARKAIAEKLPERSQQATLRSLGDEEMRALVERYVQAWEAGDVETVASLLAEDAALTMPPLASWFRGRAEIATFLKGWPLSGRWRWRHLPANANAQPALGCYCWDPAEAAFLPFSLEVLSFRGREIAAIDAFVTRAAEAPDDDAYADWPEQPTPPERLEAMFARFGLPRRLD